MQASLTTLQKKFHSGETRSFAFRSSALLRLKQAITENEAMITEALRVDLGKSAFDSWTSEIGFVLQEIDHALAHLGHWMKPKRVSTPLFLWPARSKILHEPKGVVLILGAWNYPFQLVMSPLVAALAAGNLAILKSSEFAPATVSAIDAVIKQAFTADTVVHISGDAAVSRSLTTLRFDHIFFTGSTAVGKLVMKAAAENLVSVTLELGGKSPCIVDRDVNLAVAARRIVWGKFYNAGQTCVAPDYVIAHDEIKSALIEAMKTALIEFHGANAESSQHYGRIINAAHCQRLAGLLDGQDVVHGGRYDVTSRYFEPTMVVDPNVESGLMMDEIFGPILPVISYAHIDEVTEFVNNRPAPLACYVFTENKDVATKVTEGIRFGGGCVNNTVLHLANSQLPFGGTSESGMGRYHGHSGFLEFSRQKSILKDSLRVDLRAKYPPYVNLRWLKFFMK